MYKLWLGFRSTLFWVIFMVVTLIVALLLSLSIWSPLVWRITLIKLWINSSLTFLQFFCGLHYQIEGQQNIPENGFIVMSKHSSTWETIALQKFFDPMVWVVKKELTRIPFFGWGLIAMNAIALNRGSGSAAIKQLISESKIRMDEGRILMLFPEGTRVMPGEKKKFKLGGAIVSEKTGYAVLPVAHNAGEFWPRHSWIKWPGKIHIVIGEPINPQGQQAEQIIAQVEDWITTTCERISDHQQLARLGVEVVPR
ncbi:MAG: 1-acyl-sn-glycerol-3-phosphate acyltransferase [Gammaproteobacteria bacterium]|nr:1-acyl-sn-glycerol-3-phosphate acyltransferase [Gammaproteobacteria bacterium]